MTERAEGHQLLRPFRHMRMAGGEACRIVRKEK